MFRLLRAVRRNREGSVAVEFALFAPVIAVTLLTTADLGLVVYDRMKLTAGVRTATQYVMAGGSDSSVISQLVDDASGLSASTATVIYCECPDAPGTTVTCGSTCNNGDSERIYRRIEADYTSTRILKSWPLTSQLDVRTQ